VTAPTVAKTEQQFSISYDIYPWADIEVSSILVEVYGNIGANGDWSNWNHKWTNMTMHSGTEYVASGTFFVDSNFSTILGGVGDMYGRITASYKLGIQSHLVWSEFRIGNIYPVTYSDLRQTFDTLSQSYDSLNQRYLSETDSLRSSLYLYQLIAFTFLGTAFVLGTVLLVVRKHKGKVSSDTIPSSQPPKT
jgi:hypothetical protein